MTGEAAVPPGDRRASSGRLGREPPGAGRPEAWPFAWPAPQALAVCVARRRASPAGTVACTGCEGASHRLFRAVLEDEGSRLALLFLGRLEVPGVVPGACLQVEGMVGTRRGELVMWNPRYRFLA